MPKANVFISYIGKELLLSILMFAIPIALSYYFLKIDGLDKTLSGVIPPDIFFKWTGSIGVIGFVLIELDYWHFPMSNRAEAIWKWLCKISHELAASIIGLLRLISGVLIGFVATWACVDSSGFNVAEGMVFLGYAVIAIVETAFLTYWITKRKPHERAQ